MLPWPIREHGLVAAALSAAQAVAEPSSTSRPIDREFQATSLVSVDWSGSAMGVMSAGRSSSLPLWNIAPGRIADWLSHAMPAVVVVRTGEGVDARGVDLIDTLGAWLVAGAY